MMKVAFLVFAAACLLGGCLTRSMQQLPELAFTCVVVDHVTRQPIPGARVLIVERASTNTDDAFYHGPFMTNREGLAKVAVKPRKVEVADAKLYYRSLDIEARGYSSRTFDLDTEAAREALKAGTTHTFDLFPASRRFRPAPKTITQR